MIKNYKPFKAANRTFFQTQSTAAALINWNQASCRSLTVEHYHLLQTSLTMFTHHITVKLRKRLCQTFYQT